MNIIKKMFISKRKIIQQNNNIINELNLILGQIVDIEKKMEKNNDILYQLEENTKILKEKIDNNTIKNEEKNKSILQMEKNINSIIEKIKYFNCEITNLNDSNKKIKILICGFYGAPNLGDELMLQTLLSYFNKEKVDITIMLSDNLEFEMYDLGLPNIKYIHYPHTIYDLNCLSNNFDKLIFGGGALLDDDYYMDNNNFKLSMSTILLELSYQFIINKKEVYWIGLSSNKDFKNEIYIQKLRKIINNIKYVSLRDTNSLNVFKKNKIKTTNINIINDIILANKLFQKQYVNKEKKIIGIIFITDLNLIEKEAIFINKIISEIKKNNSEYKIHLIPFYNYSNWDNYYYEKILEKIADKEFIRIKNYSNSLKEIIDAILECEIIISMRYHGSLLSMILNKKVITLLNDQHPHYFNKIHYIHKKYCQQAKIFNFSDLYLNDKVIKELNILEKCNFDKKNLVIASNEIRSIIDLIEN